MKSKYYYNKFVLEVSECYTSKTCSRCGCINYSLGSNEIFKCTNPNCLAVFSRDPHGALNIQLKKFTEIIKKKSNNIIQVSQTLIPGTLCSGCNCKN